MSNCKKSKVKCNPKLYVNTEIQMQLSLQDNIDFNWDDLTNIQVIFTSKDTPATSVTFSKLNGHIINTIEDTILKIPSVAGITTPGVYSIRCIVTHGSSVIGITPCPEELTFW